MQLARQRIAIVFGGRSAEHDVSLRSAAGVLAALDTGRFEARLVPVDRSGRFLSSASSPRRGTAPDAVQAALAQGQPSADLAGLFEGCAAALPLVHGPGGEDGSLQGLFEQLRVPYVGSGVFASSLCMDKGHFKRWLRAHDLPMAPYVCLDIRAADEIDRALDAAQATLAVLRYPLFVKPANLGSSIGISKVAAPAQLPAAVAVAHAFDRRVVIEQGLDARELEVAVLERSGAPALVSDVGEIALPSGIWYDYETKYETAVAELRLPAELPADTRARARQLALETFTRVGARGLARIDFFLDRSSGQLFINEVNTLPGFTSISMYPRLMDHAGVAYPQLVTALIESARLGT